MNRFNDKPMPENIIVFDIETIPDTSFAGELCEGMAKNEKDTPYTKEELLKLSSSEKYTKGEIEGLTEQQKRYLMERYHIENHRGNSFLRQPFHKIGCISFLEASIELQNNREQYIFNRLASYNSFSHSEEDVVRKFWELIEKRKPRLISFNGYNFDMNVLKCRAMKYGIDCKWYFEYGGKWDGYESRYTNLLNMDIFNENFGEYTLHEMCIFLNIPCKLGVDGSYVAEYFDNGKYKEICEYCETDVLATYLVYLRMSLTKGFISKEEYNKCIRDIEDFLQKPEIQNKKGLKDFLDAWYKLNPNGLFLV